MVIETFLKNIEQHYASNLPFVVYRKPNICQIDALLQKDTVLHVTKDFSEKGFVFSPFDHTEDSILLPIEHAELQSIVYDASNEEKVLNTRGNTIDEEAKVFHVDLVKLGIAAIKLGEFQKVVLSRREAVDLKAHNPIIIFKNLIEKYKSAFVYCWYHPKIGLWLGATPETLLKIEGNNFSIMALAGTQNYKEKINVVWKDKELQEQQFVTDFIMENIQSTVENIKVSNVETVKAGNLLHLRTLIEGNLKIEGQNFKKLLKDLHPTPAVCGLPKENAKRFILKHENYNREFYTGFLGELNYDKTIKPKTGKRNIEHRAYTITKKSTQLYVNLRCMQIKDRKALVYVGGGITAISNPVSEWEETVSKSLIIKKVL